jgi:tellurite resistance protein TerC
MPLAVASSTLDVSALMWAGLGVFVVAMLAVDLLLFGRGEAHKITLKSSAIWSVVWLLVALAFGGVLFVTEGSEPGGQYLAGYLLERSLSLDNLFIFAIILSYFAVPLDVQPRVLGWGIVLALALRLVFILVGAALLEQFHVTFYAFGLLLVYTAYKLARHDTTDIDPEKNPVLRLVRRRVPMTEDYRGSEVTVMEHGKRLATPLLAVFLVIATTDLIFAVDSIPAIFAVTTDSFIVFAANAFAMLGLRALYFLLVGVMDRFVYLSYGLAVILAIIGAKMLLIDVWHPPIWLSLVVIVVVLAATAVLSLRAEPKPHAAAATEPEVAADPARDEPPVAAA